MHTGSQRYMVRETIVFAGVEYNISTTSADTMAWTCAYARGYREPNHQVPAIRYEAVFPWEDAGYQEMIYINDNSIEDDPNLVACWDFYGEEKPEWRGKYQHCYIDVKADWYRKHGAWGCRANVPAHVIEVGYMPADDLQPYPSAYIYICSKNYLISCFEKWGLIEERA